MKQIIYEYEVFNDINKLNVEYSFIIIDQLQMTKGGIAKW